MSRNSRTRENDHLQIHSLCWRGHVKKKKLGKIKHGVYYKPLFINNGQPKACFGSLRARLQAVRPTGFHQYLFPGPLLAVAGAACVVPDL